MSPSSEGANTVDRPGFLILNSRKIASQWMNSSFMLRSKFRTVMAWILPLLFAITTSPQDDNVALMMTSDSIGPHAISHTTPANQISLMNWLLGLHLAWYCLESTKSTGFPTWMHRWFGLQMHKDSRNQHVLTQHREKDASFFKIMGYLILLQAMGVAVPAVARRLLEFWCLQRESTPTQRRQERQGASAQSSIRFMMDPPSIQQPLAVTSTEQRVSDTDNDVAAGVVLCGICQRERHHPACPPCGHVFCWDCLQHWLTVVRSECPFCRKPCRPQAVLPLCNYNPIAR